MNWAIRQAERRRILDCVAFSQQAILFVIAMLITTTTSKHHGSISNTLSANAAAIEMVDGGCVVRQGTALVGAN